MAKYKVEYEGFMYVEAGSREEAEEKYFNGDSIYEETGSYEIFEVSDFTVEV